MVSHHYIIILKYILSFSSRTPALQASHIVVYFSRRNGPNRPRPDSAANPEKQQQALCARALSCHNTGRTCNHRYSLDYTPSKSNEGYNRTASGLGLADLGGRPCQTWWSSNTCAINRKAPVLSDRLIGGGECFLERPVKSLTYIQHHQQASSQQPENREHS